MPYRVIGDKIYSKSSGRWRLKQTAKNAANAKAALRLLYGIEGGMGLKKQKRRKRG